MLTFQVLTTGAQDRDRDRDRDRGKDSAKLVAASARRTTGAAGADSHGRLMWSECMSAIRGLGGGGRCRSSSIPLSFFEPVRHPKP